MTRRRWWIAAPILLLLLLLLARGMIIRRIGGAFEHEPAELEEGLSDGARALLERAWEGIDPRRLLDYHVHVVGLGTGGSGAYVHPDMLSWWHVQERMRFEVYASSAGVTDYDRADAQYVARLVDLVRHIPNHGRHLLLAFDQFHGDDGEPVTDKTRVYAPNDYIFRLAERHPDLFVPAASVHPYRKDALAELERCAARGARVVKWLPNAMGIDPLDDRCAPFYARMKALGLTLLSHAGDEYAVEADDLQQLGNPLRLRRPLDAGVKVIVAHCASLGWNADLDDPGAGAQRSFDLFLRLMGEKRYEGLLFGEISGVTQFNRLPGPLLALLERPELHERLVNGSDYPLPAINLLFRTSALVDAGLVTESEREQLNEIYDYNPLLFDLVVKRTVKHPEDGTRFPPSVFMRRD